MPEPVSPKEPDTLATALAGLIASHPPGSRLHNLGVDMQHAHGRNLERRTAVLKHPDLAARLVTELGYANPRQWNGYVPPSTINPGDNGGMLSGAIHDGRGGMRFVFNQVGRYAAGEQANGSPRRAILLELSQEAWLRAQESKAASPQNPLNHLDPDGGLD